MKLPGNITRRSAYWFALCACLCCVLALSNRAFAAGTAAGTVIHNSANVTFTMNAATQTITTNTTAITVSEVLNVAVTWLDVPPGVYVLAGQQNQYVTMRVTNTGNGTEGFSLAVNAAVGGGVFNPQFVAIYLDTNGNNIFDPGVDVLYTPGVNDPVLSPDAAVTVFLMNNIPSTPLSAGDKGNEQLTAVSRTGSGTPGAILAGLGDNGTNAVIGGSGGKSAAIGTFVINGAAVVLTKSATVLDPRGGSLAVSGSRVHYTVKAIVSGTGTITNIVVTDPLPANTTYLPNTLKLNGTLLTDAADGDAGDMGSTTNGTVTVKLGDLTALAPEQTIVFDVTIN